METEMNLKEWARLHAEDPALFEQRKQAALEDLITRSRSPETLRRLLDRIRAIDAAAKQPAVAYEEILRILRVRLGEEILPALNELGRRIESG